MREFNFPKAITLRLNLDHEDKARGFPSAAEEDISIIEKNRSEILAAMITIEDRIIEAMSKYLFKESKVKRDYFVNEVIGTSDFTFSFKRKSFTRMLEQFELLDPDSIKELKANLNKLMLWRNAFAHGQVIHDQHNGYVLKYYSGGRQELVLNDAFFERAEEAFRSCLYVCNGIIQSRELET
ncbi:hypothetical protein [Motiliproteus sp. SC1-56]|uniref:hypothetical protein n=1 Tax=Motiliproteus sp. SC1-56 TaxID=2799565 RepID=UPI001A903AC9|nr:hypothetical protein [Motiliproteus sp. SC1-56]